ncbi:hypothetical protein [Pseudogemmobacter humi]|uniref:Uncharacterized protein n=1 Tax=Pseudogemmobacter humi TaxID=2483812 RepID=A0A3P5WW18_9RHOB|nr:hypothetical protein [Pseudogemmobacter humi]VDC23280.1 hypothetical protein XINFAN_00974 [Pseudogemmobacter humi]
MAVFRFLFAVLLGGLAPALADPAGQTDEPLVMRLIFEDCLGYVTAKKPPFEGLALAPIPPEAEASLPAASAGIANRHQLLSPRYFAIWGEDEDVRLCMIQTMISSDEPMLLVETEGFLDRITARAAAHGMTEADVGEEFSPFYTNDWSEPGDDGSTGLRMVVMPTGGTEDGALADAGLIIVAAGLGWRPPSN